MLIYSLIHFYRITENAATFTTNYILGIATGWHFSWTCITVWVWFTTAMVDKAWYHPSALHCELTTYIIHKMYVFKKLLMQYMIDVLLNILCREHCAIMAPIMQIRGKHEVSSHRMIIAVNIAWFNVQSWLLPITKT